MSDQNKSTYQQGYHRSVTAAHARRTAEVEGAFVLPHLKPDFKILDIGCGPGTISIGFAKYVPSGHVTGIDLTDDVLSQAREQLSSHDSQPQNITFELGNVVDGLKYPSDTFDVVFTNQVLIHIPDPVTALREMKRVVKPGGIVCCREGDFPSRFYPYPRGLQLFNKYLYCLLHSRTPDLEHPENAPHPPDTRTGSLVHVWARLAGFEPQEMVKGASLFMCTTEDERRGLGGLMVERILVGGTGDGFRARGATEDEIQCIVDDFNSWIEDVDGWFALLQAEVVLSK